MLSSFYGRECNSTHRSKLVTIASPSLFSSSDKDKVYASISCYLIIRCILGIVCALARPCVDTHILNHVADFLKVQHAGYISRKVPNVAVMNIANTRIIEKKIANFPQGVTTSIRLVFWKPSRIRLHKLLWLPDSEKTTSVSTGLPAKLWYRFGRGTEQKHTMFSKLPLFPAMASVP
uniref:Uncharacterized protein n=1 Tax=Glossina pallidipes TaxID=7398 RepID=A0A1B0AA92_GLOPL